MKAYIIRRLLLIIPTLFILSILVFLSVRFLPGDTIDAMLGKPEFISGEVDREALEHMLGLDVPVHVQYGRWIGGILRHGTLGNSLLGSRGAVEEKLIDRLPVTIELGVLAILIGLLIALPVGIYSAMRQDTAADYVGRSVAIIGLATPNFWLDHGRALPLPLVGVVATDTVGSFQRRSAGESRGVDHSQRDFGDGDGGGHHAADAHHDAGGAETGLYPYRLVQGAPGAGRDHPAHHQKCPHPGGLPDRSAITDPGRGGGDHGGHLQPAGARASHGDGPRRSGLPGGLRGQPVLRQRGGATQSPHRPDLSLFGPQGAV